MNSAKDHQLIRGMGLLQSTAANTLETRGKADRLRRPGRAKKTRVFC
jgi:hypothetical protein